MGNADRIAEMFDSEENEEEEVKESYSGFGALATYVNNQPQISKAGETHNQEDTTPKGGATNGTAQNPQSTDMMNFSSVSGGQQLPQHHRGKKASYA